MKHLLIIDDHTMFRQALTAVLNERSAALGGVVCDGVGSVTDAWKRLAEATYDLVLLDISMPQVSGIDLLPQLKIIYPNLPVLILSMYAEDQFALQALRLGASGYLTKQEAAEELMVAMNCIFSGKRYLSRTFSSKVVDQMLDKGKATEPPHLKLSRRELEVLKRLAKGQTQKKISEEMVLSNKSISTYKTRMYHKMGFNNAADLISYMIRNPLD
jgi:DNA-binding NarL/FixJ family response regulator